MRFLLTIALLLTAAPVFADVSVVAAVDRNHLAFGESVTLTISVQGAQNAGQPAIPNVNGLSFSGPAINTSVSIVNGAMSQSVNLTYQITPARTGEFTIPAIEVTVAGKSYATAPIKLTVEKSAVASDLSQKLFTRVQLPPQVYLGQTAPVDVYVFVRADLPVKVANFNCDAGSLGYKFLANLKQGSQVINGESFNVYVIQGAISPTQPGPLTFGPCVVKGQMTVQKRGRGSPFDDPFFNQFFGNVEVREVTVPVEPVALEVVPLPAENRPADFAGAVGQWNLEVTAKPTEVAVGDPVTLTIKVSGTGNIDTVPAPKLTGLDEFKTYDPTTKTTKNDLNTAGERVIQQVLIARSTEAKQLPEVRLAFFDPVAKAYRTAGQPAIKLVVKARAAGRSTIVSGGLRMQPQEKLGQDIVYLKGDLGTAPANLTPSTFWLLNAVPVFGLLGAVAWKRRTDRLRGDIAYARRSRAAKTARKRLATAANCDQVQHALQGYLGDRLNIPAGGITASVADEHRLPAGVAEIFQTSDAARFAGAQTDLAALKQRVERVIDELEDADL